MAKDVIMPVLGMAQDSGVVVSWLKQQGEFVEEGEPLLEVETDKAVVEVPAMASGVLADVTAVAGAEVPTGTVIARLLDEGETPDRSSAAGSVAQASSTAEAPAAPAAEKAPSVKAMPESNVTPAVVATPSVPVLIERDGKDQARLLASPKAKRLARELGMDLRSVSGTGPNGAVRAKDLAAVIAPAAEARSAPAASWLRRPVTLTPMWELLANANALMDRSRRGVTITAADVLARLTVAALAASGNPVPQYIRVTRYGAARRPESCRITDPLRSTIVAYASGWNAPSVVEGQAVEVLDLTDSPFESPLPALPQKCQVRVTLTSITGDDSEGTLTLEHVADPGIEPAALMTRLVELLVDPVAALLYV